jgi:serine/threonine protein phosphatase PrpC
MSGAWSVSGSADRSSVRGTRLHIDVGARTDVGRIRRNNEDAYRVERALDLYVLSDGMGGEANGEVASAMAVEAVAEHCLEAERNRATPLLAEPRLGRSDRTNRLISAVVLANRKIFELASSDPLTRGMGATIVTAWITGSQMCVVHVGDSRAYLLRAGALQQITADHSLVAEQVRLGILTPQQAATSALQSVLLRALGTAADVAMDVDERELLAGDAVLLCSDGLTRMLDDDEIAAVLMMDEPAQKAADHLVDMANERGGEDNVSVIVARTGVDSNHASNR